MSQQLRKDQPAKYDVSVIMATFNGDKFIEAQLDSIINQSYRNWNLIIRDDGSTDQTLQIIKKYITLDNRISLLSDKDGNLGFNQNFLRLISSTDSRYISICDQDDVWLPEKLEVSLDKIKIIETADKHPALVHSDAMIVDEKLNLISSKWIGKRGNVSGINGLVFSNTVQGAACLFNDSLKKIALNSVANLPYDYHLGLLAAFNGHRFYIEKPLIKYRQHNQNAIGALDIKQRFNFKYYVKQLIDILKKTYNSIEYEKLSETLKCSLEMYYKIKFEYAKTNLSCKNRKALEDYLYLFEGKYKINKLLILSKNKYSFSCRKDFLIFLFLVIAGRNLKSPKSW